MNRALQWKLIAGFILVFIAGGMTGAFLGGIYARHLFFEFHQPGLMAIRMRDRLRTELHLTPEQVAKISPIIDKTAANLAGIRRETGRHVHEIMIEAHREMAANLTEDQRLKLQEIESRRRHWHGFRDSRPAPSASPESSARPP
jgi:Spy/CpxP family protein refolding chaperone